MPGPEHFPARERSLTASPAFAGVDQAAMDAFEAATERIELEPDQILVRAPS